MTFEKSILINYMLKKKGESYEYSEILALELLDCCIIFLGELLGIQSAVPHGSGGESGFICGCH
jgi:hypothetical protein